MREVRLIWCKVFWQHLAGFCLAKLPLNCLGLWSFVFINQSNLFYCFPQSMDQTWLLAAASEVSNDLPWSNLPQISTLWGATCHVSLVLPWKMERTLNPSKVRKKRHENNTCLSKKKVSRDFLQLHPSSHLHTENWGAERLMQLCAGSAPAQCTVCATAEMVQERLQQSRS